MFTIASPFEAAFDGTATPSVELAEGAIGQCTQDTFQVTGSGGASPVICGSNDGQHSEFVLFLLLFVCLFVLLVYFLNLWIQ